MRSLFISATRALTLRSLVPSPQTRPLSTAATTLTSTMQLAFTAMQGAIAQVSRKEAAFEAASTACTALYDEAVAAQRAAANDVVALLESVDRRLASAQSAMDGLAELRTEFEESATARLEENAARLGEFESAFQAQLQRLRREADTGLAAEQDLLAAITRSIGPH